MDKMLKFLITIKANEWLQENPERLNSEEILKFRQGLEEYLNQNCETLDDEVYDFLVDENFIKNKRREDSFASYLNNKYKDFKFKKILDVGAGRMCRLSTVLAKYGAELYAIDPKIRLTEREAKRKITEISKDYFVCDEFAVDGKGTDVSNFDLIVGLEPCDATEHIIRQSLKYDKPFDILLCAAPHDAINGKKINSYKKWYEHLRGISPEVQIKKLGNNFYATNYEPEK